MYITDDYNNRRYGPWHISTVWNCLLLYYPNIIILIFPQKLTLKTMKISTVNGPK